MKPTQSPHLVPFDGSFKVASVSTTPPAGDGKSWGKKKLKKLVEELAELQAALYATDSYSLLLVFQALDAAGKDGVVRAVTSGVNPAGFQVFSFKKPSAEELDHDFLWRTSRALPERGRIGIFNRSYYEDVLVVRVHPEYLAGSQLPKPIDFKTVWTDRYESIRNHEKHLVQNGTVVLKFWLNVSRAEQKRRFVSRIDTAEKNWKFSVRDVEESWLYPEYLKAYEASLAATSTKWAPWYAIPADDKEYARWAVADVVVRTLRALPLAFPEPSADDRKKMKELRKKLAKDD
ncbi:MAG: polyphosphate kinase 2 family protein [Polyangiaceae bacterium]|nr:polyphosphate kinase 2 family protein [Polyangiaceae bacterium]